MGSCILWSYLAQFFVQAQKNKKVNPEKNSLFYRKWNFLPLILKTFQETETLKKLLIFQEMELFSPPRENVSYLRKRKPRKNFLYFLKASCSYIWETEITKNVLFISGNGTFLYFVKAYSELEAYSKP